MSKATMYTVYYGGKRLDDFKADDTEHARQVGSIAFKVPVVAIKMKSSQAEHDAAAKESKFGALPLESA